MILKWTMRPPIELLCERLVGVVIIGLAVRVSHKWLRGSYRRLHRPISHMPIRLRTPVVAFGIDILHGLAGTGAIMLMLFTAIQDPAAVMAAVKFTTVDRLERPMIEATVGSYGFYEHSPPGATPSATATYWLRWMVRDPTGLGFSTRI